MAILKAEVLDRLCWQLHLLYKAGVPSEESLALLAQDTPEKSLADTYKSISDGLAKGDTFSESVVSAGVFPAHFVNMISIGEQTGRMEQVLSSLSSYYRREADTQSNLRRAVTYPAMMAVLIAIVFSVLLVRVLPVFSGVFEQMGIEMPALTRTLLSAGNISMYVAAAFCAAILAAAIVLVVRVNRGSNLPIGKNAKRTLDQSRFSSAMALMLKSALPIEAALEKTADLMKGSTAEEKVRECRKMMDDGASFTKALTESGVLSPLQSGILAAGARAGASDEAMEEVAQRSLEEADDTLARFIGAFEFVLVAILCLSIGLVLLSVMLPLIGILSSLG